MINEIKKKLPLKITEISWDGAIFQMHGLGWNFVSLSSWRIVNHSKMILGCYDDNSKRLIENLKDVEIVDVGLQETILKIDPSFYLSNEYRIEIFSTDTFEPWTFSMDGLGFYSATPNESKAFDSKVQLE